MQVIISAVASLSIMGFIFAALLAYASEKFAVEVDPKEEKVLKVLPGANCGACGFPGCSGLAAAIARGDAPANACPVGGATVAEKVSEIMGVEAQTGVRKIANVHCNGTHENAVQRAKYDGVLDCNAAMIASGGDKMCSFGCMGLGSCVKACAFDAIFIGADGVAHVDREKCVSCGKCIEACPKNIIAWIPEDQEVYINCSSHDKGKPVKDSCTVGCIACSLCVKNCPKECITMVNDLPVIDYEKCIQCNICANKCPTKAINPKERKKKVVVNQEVENTPIEEEKGEEA